MSTPTNKHLEAKVTKWLQSTNRVAFSVFCILAAFCTYSCMYAFRKPFAVATFEDEAFWGIDYKILLITAQVLGYTLSKFIGIRVISEMKNNRRSIFILLLIVSAALALLGFALAPAPWGILFLFLNGLPLGMVWGLVFSFLEGRQTTEVLGAGLSVSFIFSSGFVKTVGKVVMLSWGVSEDWMPFVTGSLFLVPLLGFVWLLDRIPEPSPEDVAMRTKREPMSKAQRRQFLVDFGGGMFLLTLVYILLTAFRDFRDNFSAEIWQVLGYGDNAEIFTLTEIPVSIAVLVLLGLMMGIKQNYKALNANYLIIIGGFAVSGVSTLLFQNHMISPPLWMILVGLGLYLGYVPFNSILFDRLIAAFRVTGNVGFLIYLADSFGYLGSVVILFYKNFGFANLSWLEFFTQSIYVVSVSGTLLMGFCIVYFRKKYESRDGLAVLSVR
ncbi:MULTISPECIES: DUF5690 family protein [unclassified Imperialibacter]|uniref:DUF5690 family protein n=1 Tax=unclassified Imperialibacter TaxID=2629706 RepID=UPI00125B28EA|nr:MULTISPECIES: DUF5690 family protein [unclassified Imperialibacter]CAD5293075.1 conserved membrane hypothetical protein [Imperialibacter sp. 89]CAD5294142.1 conserved membrane hypothetical protein [Imperialibacter sp. 75]VVT18536.1 conserved membrane hypothetical protein [Imperialibacter sp. EC-SDR9]